MLMLASIRNDEPTVRLLLEMGADPDTETPPQGTLVSVILSFYIFPNHVFSFLSLKKYIDDIHCH